MDIDLDLEGMGGLQASFEELQERGEADAVFSVGTNVEYGVYLEFGTEDMPPYPWFRPAIREFQANPESFVTDNTGWTDIEEIPNADELVKAVATALANQMTKNVSAETATDRSPGTHPEHPERDTGTLANSISAVRIQ